MYPNNYLNITKNLQERKIKGGASIRKTVPSEIYTRTILYKKLMGHLSSVYCVCFDNSGQYIFTGADDHLIKIWSARDGRLLNTLRGHDGQITDMSVNYENRLLASGGMDRVIRIWDLKTSKLLDCLNAHSAVVTTVKFAPYNRHGNHRYLISTSNDGSVVFWEYHKDKFQFKKLKKFIERNKPGGRIVCSSFSVGGSFLACGSSDHFIHVYGFHPECGPYWLAELDHHKDQVDSIQFCNQGFRFLTGSQDGTAAIWRYVSGLWKPIRLDMSIDLDRTYHKSKTKPAVLIVQWSRDDRYVLTSIIDYSIKVWNSETGQLVHVLREHNNNVYLLESHPVDPRIFVSASHDGYLIIWDIDRAKVIKRFQNKADTYEYYENSGLASIYDVKFSPDGSMIATTDSYGYLSLYGDRNNDFYKEVPDQMFFHTDYRALIRDVRHFVMDEQTHLAPHLMPKPTLVDMNGNPYPASLQRLVPDYRSTGNYVVVPLSETQINTLAEIISNHSKMEDEEYLAEKRSPSDDLIHRPKELVAGKQNQRRYNTRYSTRYSFRSARSIFMRRSSRRARNTSVQYFIDDDTTEVESDDETIIDSDATEIDSDATEIDSTATEIDSTATEIDSDAMDIY